MGDNNRALPMAIAVASTELSMSFEFITDPAEENLFFLMQRPKGELFTTFSFRFERNLTKRYRKTDLSYSLTLPTGSFIRQHDLEDMSISDVLTPGNRLTISGQDYVIQERSPKVSRFVFPKRLFIGHYVLSKLNVEHGDARDAKCTWYRRPYDFKKKTASGATWQPVDCDTSALKLRPEDAGHQFKIEIEPRRGDVVGVRAIHYTTSPPEVHDACDDANYLGRSKATPEVLVDRFRVVSYNLLAEMYTDTKEAKDMFGYCPKEYLEFSYRKSAIFNELLSYNADILLLQEVDCHFYDTLALSLPDFGSAFLPKGDIREGCAIFFRSSKFRFQIVFQYTISDLLNEKANLELREALKSNPEVLAQLEKLPNTLMIAFLEDPSTNRKWLVANTHLYAGETADTIRFLQAYLCFTHLRRHVAKVQDKHVHVLFAGDFNSTPDTCVLEILKGHVSLSRFPEYPNQEFDFRLDDFALTSACGLPEYTNYTKNFVGCLDYIFHDPGTLKVHEVVPMPTHEEVIEHVAIPSRKFASDHIPLICTFEYVLNE